MTDTTMMTIMGLGLLNGYVKLSPVRAADPTVSMPSPPSLLRRRASSITSTYRSLLAGERPRYE